MAEIELRNVSRRFDQTRAVRRVSLSVHDGEFFVLVGPSGCGKSTVLNMIVGLERPDEGDIRVDGRPVDDLDPKDRNMAMVFQSYAIYPHMTVGENIAFPLELARLPKDEIRRRVQRTAEILEIEDLLDRKPRALSGGQRQRVAMGRAIVREPNAFLLDEPLSNLDSRLRVQMRIEIARLQRRLGTTTVYVTHDQTEAMTLGDRIAVMRKGELLQVGTPRELYERPSNLFVAGFIGSPTMNFLPGRWSGERLELPFGPLEPAGAGREAVGASGNVIAGFRPEHLCLVGEGEEAAGRLSFDARIEVVEWLGADLFVHADIAADIPLDGLSRGELPEDLDVPNADEKRWPLTARIDPGARLRVGDTVRLGLDPRHVQVFDAESGESRMRARQV